MFGNPVEKLLDIQHLTLESRHRTLLDNLSLTVNRGERVALVGQSGSGKSLTAKSVLALLPPDVAMTRGTIVFRGEDLTELPRRRLALIRGRSIGLIPQDPRASLNPSLTVRKQLLEVFAHPAAPKLTEREKLDRIREALRDVRLEDTERVLDRYPYNLSGGMCQRVLLAMALLQEPELLIADEPTTALDTSLAAEILDLLIETSERRGISVLYISHNLGLVKQFARRLTVIRHGERIEAGTTEEIFERPAAAYTKALLKATTNAAEEAAPPSQLGKTVLRADSLTKTFAKKRYFSSKPSAVVKAVSEVSFTLREHEVVAVIGESGCGKSTLLRLIAGIIAPDAGSVIHDDALTMDFIFQNPKASLNPKRRLIKILKDAVASARQPYTEGTARQAIADVLASLGLDELDLDKTPVTCSGGEQQRLALARALLSRADVLLMDEAFSALDSFSQRQILTFLQERKAANKLTALIVTHDLGIMSALADSVLVMADGEIVDRGTPREILYTSDRPVTVELVKAYPFAIREEAGA